MESSQAAQHGIIVGSLDRGGCLREGFVEGLDTRVLVLLSEVPNSFRFLVFGCYFLGLFDFQSLARLGLTSTLGLGK